MEGDLKKVYKELLGAINAEDFFGRLVSDKIEDQLIEVKELYREAAKICHPDFYEKNPDLREIAEDAMKLLSKFREEAEEKILRDDYDLFARKGRSKNADFVIKTKIREYYIKSAIAEGDLSTVYGGYAASGDSAITSVVIKIAKDVRDNDLLQNEARVVKFLQREPSRQSKHFPVFLDQFRTNKNQIGLVFKYLDGHDFYSIREREKYKNGIDRKHMVWILNRILSAVGYAHSIGIVHGNIEPSHILVRPNDHNVFLIDWSYAAINPFGTGDGFKIYNEDFSPPEVKEKKSPIPASDLYSIGKCMIYILGGDVKTNEMPKSVEEPLQRFIKFFVRESPLQRTQDGWEMHAELIRLVESLWGKRRFLDFKM